MTKQICTAVNIDEDGLMTEKGVVLGRIYPDKPHDEHSNYTAVLNDGKLSKFKFGDKEKARDFVIMNSQPAVETESHESCESREKDNGTPATEPKEKVTFVQEDDSTINVKVNGEPRSFIMRLYNGEWTWAWDFKGNKYFYTKENLEDVKSEVIQKLSLEANNG